eukprot:CAMPEP_0171080456 /NCGR_PEP_ID=MMETSP0766_2-20121228/15879_1 /TAXON_ID=439317 /ORGANISM="Gambierdiscus australes, Strain CAWD 149" /LENGTH=87 /DNA_ID=CAMNT_0011537697 /DNA_START=35 /DNA_END=295 /DNA_ORIENTATION=+
MTMTPSSPPGMDANTLLRELLESAYYFPRLHEGLLCQPATLPTTSEDFGSGGVIRNAQNHDSALPALLACRLPPTSKSPPQPPCNPP